MSLSRATLVVICSFLVCSGRSGFAQVITVGGPSATTYDAEYSPDGSRIVIANFDWTVRIYDATTGIAQKILRGHLAEVNTARFNPSGTRIVSAARDGAAIIWDAATGAIVRVLGTVDTVHRVEVRGAWFSPDGSRVLTMSGFYDADYDDPNNSAVLWDAASGQRLFTFHHHQGINAAAFSADGSRVITASNDSTATVWNTATGAAITTVRHAAQVWQASFSEAGDRILTGGSDHVANVWDATTGAKLSTMQMPSELMLAQFNHAATVVIAADYQVHLRLFDASSGSMIRVFTNDKQITRAQFTPDDKHVLTSGYVDVQQFNVETGAREFVADPVAYETPAVSFSPDYTHFLEASGYSAMVYDASNGKRTLWIDGDRLPVITALFTPDGTKVLTGGYDGTAYLWDASNGAPLRPYIGSNGAVECAVYNRAGTQILLGGQNGWSKLWDAAGDSVLTTFPRLSDQVTMVGYSPDESEIFEGTFNNEVLMCNRTTGAMIRKLSSSDLWWAEYSRDGSLFATASHYLAYATARVWDAHTGVELNDWEQDGQMNVARFSPDGTRFLTTSTAGTASVYSITDSLKKLYLQPNAGAVVYGEWSPDGRRIMTLCSDTVIQLWDAATGALVHAMHGPHGSMNRARFNADGTMIVSSGDSTGYVWDAVNGVLLHELIGHTATINSIAWNPAGNRIVTSSDDHTSKIWGPIFPAVSVREEASVLDPSVMQCYPNPCLPFDCTASVAFTLSQNTSVAFTLVDQLGRVVSRSIAPRMEQGSHTVQLTIPTAIEAGVYRCVLRTARNLRSLPLVVVR